MADIVSQRQTHILVADEGGLYPAETVIPADDLFPIDPNLLDITNIVAGSLKLSELIAEKVPQFGQMYASKFECKVYLTDDLKGKFIQVYQLDGDVYKAVFTGLIDSCKLDKLGTDRTIVAYDYAYTKGQLNVAEWWTQFWTGKETSTLKACRDSMLTWAGITFENVELPNDSLQITKTVDLTSCTLTTMLKMMCELSYCFPHFDRTGELKFILLNLEPEVIDLTDKYEWAKSTFEEYVTSEITGVQFYDSGSELKYTYGETDNAYPVRQNIFLYDRPTTILDSVAQQFMEYLSEFTYTPASVKMIISDLDFELGQYVHTEKGNFYILRNTLSGAQLYEQTLKAEGQSVLYGGTPNFDYNEVVLNERIARVKQTVEAFEVDYEDFKEDTAANFRVTAESISSEVSRATQAEGNLSSRITQTSQAITSEVSRATTAEGSLSSRITQNSDSISSEVTRATQAEGQLDSKITQTAQSISLEVTNGSDSSTIKLKLGQTELSSKVIQMNGLVKFSDLSDEGSTTINGSNITTGTIDASQVNVTNLNADNITTGTLSADKIKGGQLIIDTSSGYTQAIKVRVSNSDYIVISPNDGIVVGKSYGSYKTSITQNGLTVGSSSSTMVTIKGDSNSGAITVGSNSNNQTVINNGQITVNNNSWSGGSVKITNSYSGPCLVINANSDSSNAIEITRGNSSLKSVECTSLKINNNSVSTKTIRYIKSSSSSYTPGFSEIKEKKLSNTRLYAIEASSAPSMHSDGNGGYSFSSSVTWKKIELSESSYSTKVFGVTGGSSYHEPQFDTMTVWGT